MSLFCITSHPQMPLTQVAIHKRRPKSPDKTGFVVRYTSPVDSERGAELVIQTIDELMGSKTKAPGVYQARFEEVWEVYEAILMELEPAPKYPTWLRWGAFALAMAIIAGYTAAMSWLIVVWLIICAFKKQSGLVTAAETEVLFSIFDIRPILRRLLNVWKGK